MTQGWFCPHCQRGLRPVEVTYEETCTTCGTCVTDVEPPAALAEIEGLVKEAREKAAHLYRTGDTWGRGAEGDAALIESLATALETLSARVVAAGQEIIRLSVIAGEALRDQKAAESRVAELEAALRLVGERFDQLSDAPDPWTRESCEKWSAQIDAALSTEAKAQGGER